MAYRKGQDHDQLLDGLPPLAERDGDPFEQAETSVQMFFAPEALDDLLLAATVVRKLGFVPAVRLSEEGGSFTAIELYTKDVPSMARVLRESIAASNGRRT